MIKIKEKKQGNITFSASVSREKYDEIVDWIDSDKKEVRPPIGKKKCTIGDTLHYLVRTGHGCLVEKIKEDLEYKKKRLAKVSGEKE